MEFKVPFTSAKLEKLKHQSRFFTRYSKNIKNESLKSCLEYDEIDITLQQYASICIRGAFFAFIFSLLLSGIILFLFRVPRFYLIALAISLVFSCFIFITQLNYPKLYHSRRQKDIERNIIPALQDMLVQLNSGIPLFNILVNISEAGYGELSIEFKKAVKRINAGIPQIEVLEQLGEQNSSPFFRRTLWQVSNGMRAGSDISIIVKESVRALNEEQLIQIQNYGNKLNPMIMFYMLSSVIVPALSVTFLTIISSMISLPAAATYSIFGGVFLLVMLVQLMFIGVIRSLRPSLL